MCKLAWNRKKTFFFLNFKLHVQLFHFIGVVRSKLTSGMSTLWCCPSCIISADHATRPPSKVPWRMVLERLSWCMIPSLDSCQKRFLWTPKEVDRTSHPVIVLELEVGDVEKFPQALGFKSLDPLFLENIKAHRKLNKIAFDWDKMKQHANFWHRYLCPGSGQRIMVQKHNEIDEKVEKRLPVVIWNFSSVDKFLPFPHFQFPCTKAMCLLQGQRQWVVGRSFGPVQEGIRSVCPPWVSQLWVKYLVSARHHWADVFIVWRLGPDGWKGSMMNSMAMR